MAEPGPADEPLEPAAVPGVLRLPAEPVVSLRERAERQFGHQHGAGLAQPLDDRRVVVDHLVLIGRRAAGRRGCLWSRRDPLRPMGCRAAGRGTPGLDLLVRRGGLLQREFLGERHDAVEAGAVFLQPLEIHARQIGGRDVTLLDQRRERRDRQERQVLDARRGAARRCRRSRLRASRSAWRRLRLLARQIGPERDRRFGVERDVDVAQPFEVRQVRVDPVQRLLLLRVGEVDAEDLLGAVERLLSIRCGACACWARAGAARPAATAAGTVFRKRRRAARDVARNASASSS